jgi:toxin-antitoxin system PIN domain toxin
MRALLDVNVLIALLDSDHSLHARATDWFRETAPDGWASCPITQNGCVRIMSHPGYPNAVPISAVAGRLADAVRGEFHEFWPDDVSILDSALFDTSKIHGPRQLTDVYLLALAVRRGGTFVTFDAGVSLGAVAGAKTRHLTVL